MSEKKSNLSSQVVLTIMVLVLLVLLLMPASVLYTSYSYYNVAHTDKNKSELDHLRKGSSFYASAEVMTNRENPVAATQMVSARRYQTEIIWDTVFQDKILIRLGNNMAQLEIKSMMPDNQLKNSFPYVHVSPEVLRDIPTVSPEQVKTPPIGKQASLKGREILFGLSEGDQFLGQFEVIETKPLLLRMKQPLCYGKGTNLWAYYIDQNLSFVIIASILFLFAGAIWTALIINKFRRKKAI